MHSAPAKIILFGEHAVVYGQPAIAVPFTALRAMADASPAKSGEGLTILAPDIGQTTRVNLDNDHPDNVLAYAAVLTLKALNLSAPDITLKISSMIPVASGLGSGAAICAALIRELSAALGQPLEGDSLNALVYETEKRFHGTPSGIDNTVIVKGEPVYFIRGQAPETFCIKRELTFIIADTGVSAPTKESVGDVRKLYESQPDYYQQQFDRIGSVVKQARAAIEYGNIPQIGALMDENHTLLKTLTVSSPLLDTLTETARSAGAIGAKLSGGGRGGNMIALVKPDSGDEVMAALCRAGAVRAWKTTLGAS